MDDESKFFITTDTGEEKEMIAKFRFEADAYGKSYVIFYDPEDPEQECHAMSYDDNGNMFDIETEAEWEMVQEVFEALEDEEE